jgi:hypothetical protein
METRQGFEPCSRRLCGPPPTASETRAMVSSGRFERPTSSFGRWRSIPLRYEDIKCAGKDSNLRVGCLGYGQVRSPLRHRRLR